MGLMLTIIKVFTILFLLCQWERGTPWQLSKQVCKLSFQLSFQINSLLAQTERSQPPGQNQQMVNSVVYHPCSSRLATRLTLTFIRLPTLINSNLIKQKKLAFSFDKSLNNSILLVHIANCSVYLHYMDVFHCHNFEHFCMQLLL